MMGGAGGLSSAGWGPAAAWGWPDRRALSGATSGSSDSWWGCHRPQLRGDGAVRLDCPPDEGRGGVVVVAPEPVPSGATHGRDTPAARVRGAEEGDCGLSPDV